MGDPRVHSWTEKSRLDRSSWQRGCKVFPRPPVQVGSYNFDTTRQPYTFRPVRGRAGEFEGRSGSVGARLSRNISAEPDTQNRAREDSAETCTACSVSVVRLTPSVDLRSTRLLEGRSGLKTPKGRELPRRATPVEVLG